MRRKLAAGNWKMNGLSAQLAEIDALRTAHPDPSVDLVIAPPATLISAMVVSAADHPLQVAGQDCHASESGPHTGDISAPMLKDAGASHVILGHSERRTDHGEDDEDVRAKARAALAADLKVIICIGESLEEREAANTLEIIAGQLAGSLPDILTAENTVIAYEPIWAIGTGKIPTLDQIGEVHDYIRSKLEARYGAGVGRGIRILYGGSVKPSNADDIFAVSNVDGALVGGASLKAADFSGIITALENA
ncbi:triosephosphate isomerase [Litoreibacter ponti]|uniref:Triosephosphate isomerase n=1 Tax=Litoreibacter ponti TaxID=1510457 RepID=A0A2T6BKB9_9RHOB|nr:triose-phosphate isomerase [Litoreibacter ponti]PTX56520.1 triosephosphate isomerase [Litoreibacter ponti]